MMGVDASVLEAGSTEASNILHLFIYVSIVSALIFAVVAGLVFYVAWRYRARPGAAVPSQDPGNTKLEITWTVIPILIVISIFAYTVVIMSRVQPPPGDHPPDVVVTAHQWWWSFQYPDSGVVTANEVHAPVGRKLLFRVLSADVIHDFWVPALGAKVDAIPNHPNYTWYTVQKPGVYPGTCAEFCGPEHAWMRIRFVAQSPEDFAQWIATQKRVPPVPQTGAAARGARTFQKRTCAVCHTIRGTSADGKIAPDLTHVAGRATLGAGVLKNTPEEMARWIQDPQAIKPGCKMPALKLSDAETRDLVAYLETLK